MLKFFQDYFFEKQCRCRLVYEVPGPCSEYAYFVANFQVAQGQYITLSWRALREPSQKVRAFCKGEYWTAVAQMVFHKAEYMQYETRLLEEADPNINIGADLC